MRLGRLIVLICFYLSFQGMVSAQFSSTSYDQGMSVIETYDHGFAMTGYGRDTANVYVIALDSTGAKKWSNRIGGGAEYGYSIVQTYDHGYAVAGSTVTYGAGGGDVYVVKLDSAGKLMWTRTIGGTKGDGSSSILQTKDGGLIIAGYTGSYGDTVHGNTYLLKLNATGNFLWAKTLYGLWANQVITTNDGGYAISGMSGSRVYYTYLIKLDSNANVIWSKTYSPFTGTSVFQTHDNGFIMSGTSILKVDSLGNVSWAIENSPDYGYYSNSVVETKEHNYLITGTSSYYLIGTFYYYLHIIEIDSIGNLVWKRFSSGMGQSIINTSNGGYAIGGTFTYGLTKWGGTETMLFIKANKNDTLIGCGFLHDTITFHPIVISDSAGGTRDDSAGGLVSSGGKHRPGVFEFSECFSYTGISDISQPKEKITVFPNPTKGQISIELNERGNKTISIYDELGREVYTEPINPNAENQTITVNMIDRVNGVYFVRIITDKGELSKKFILEKK